jgi:DNA-binding transcriptional MocR family regulator
LAISFVSMVFPFGLDLKTVRPEQRGEHRKRARPSGQRESGAHAGVVDEQAIREEARRLRIELETMSEYQSGADAAAPALLLGYAQMPEATIRTGIRELAKAVQAARARA